MHSREECLLTPASSRPSRKCLECLLPWQLRGLRRLPTPLPALQLQQELLFGGQLPCRLVPLLALLLLRLPQLLQQGLSWGQGRAQAPLLRVLLVLVALLLQLLLLLEVVQQQGPLLLLVCGLLLRGGLLGWLLLLLLQALQQQTALLLGRQACMHGRSRVWRWPEARGRAATLVWCLAALRRGFARLGLDSTGCTHNARRPRIVKTASPSCARTLILAVCCVARQGTSCMPRR